MAKQTLTKGKPKGKAKTEDVKSSAEILREKQKEKLLELLPKLRYHISKTCERVGVHRTTLQNWLKNDADFKEKYEAVHEAKMDDAEERLYLLGHGIPELDKDGKLKGWKVKPHFGALVVQLKAQAKNRGYGDHIVIDDKRDDDNIRNKTDEELLAEMEEIRKRFSDEYNGGDNTE